MSQALVTHENSRRSADPRLSLLFRAVHGNWFYFLSAALMLLGGRLLMRSPALGGDEFGRTLKALLVLQAYEFLVIWTALLIVRRLKSLNDAFYLLLIELALLLDPTFFSNAISTFLASESPARPIAVNMACLLLVPLKLFALQQGLGIRFSTGAWSAFLFAALCSYLGQVPLTPTFFPGGHRSQEYYQYCYLLAWMPFVFTVALPPTARLARPTSEFPGCIETRRLTILCRSLLWAPILILMAHYFETIRVHQISFFAVNLAPVPLLLALLLIKNRRGSDGLLPMLDACGALAIAVSSPLFLDITQASKGIRPPGISQTPWFIVAHVPLVVCGAVAAGIYLYAFVATRRRAALVRVALLAAGALGWGLVRSGLLRLAAQESWEGASAAGASLLSSLALAKAWLLAHPLVRQSAVLAALLALALRFRNIWTSLLAGGYAIWLLAGALPRSRTYWILEMFEAWLLLAVALEFRFKVWKGRADQMAAAMAGAIGLARLGMTEAAWPYIPIAVEIVFFLTVGFVARRGAFILLAAVHAWCAAEVSLYGAGWGVASHAIVYGLVLFGIGAWITFNKDRALKWVSGLPAGPGVESGIVDPIQPNAEENLTPRE